MYRLGVRCHHNAVCELPVLTTCTHARAYARTRTRTHTHTHIHTHTHTHTRTHTNTHAHARAHTHTHTHTDDDEEDPADETYVPEGLTTGAPVGGATGAEGKEGKKVKGPRKMTEKQLKKEQMELQKRSSKMFRETAAEG
jgi:hypothetical protein